ncbi:MAG: response regulator transcription factor [Thermodesulfobacteriota bacterium]
MKGCQILIVDDEPFVLKALSFVFEKEGYDVETARDGEEGLKKIRELKPKIVFMDVMMPRKNGFDVCAEIKGDPELKDTYVILLTATGQEEDIETGYSQGADDYIIKPFSLQVVLKKIKDLGKRL